MGHRRQTVHAPFEVDVTQARRLLRDHKARTAESLSFTGFVIACLGQAIDANRYMHAYRNWRGQLVIFNDVDINTLFEVEVDGHRLIRPHIIRAADKKTFRELHEEMRAFQAEHHAGRESRFIRWFVLLPGWLRRSFLWLLSQSPHLFKEYSGTVLMTGLGMFGPGASWGIPVTNHTLQIALGGIAEKPGIVDGGVETREYMSVTVSSDHDVIDGAPAARFGQRFKELIESGYGLDDLVAPS